MALTPYCTQADVEVIWSEYGVIARIDDDFDNTEDAPELVIMASCIDMVCHKINAMLCGRYSASTLLASGWVRWCAAALTAELLAARRGNPVPQSLADEAAQYRTLLGEIRGFQADLISDAGVPAAGAHDDRPSVSNMTVDGRYTRAKVRRVDSTSTGLPSAGKSNPVFDFYLFP